jgi:hypothetical protein
MRMKPSRRRSSAYPSRPARSSRRPPQHRIKQAAVEAERLLEREALRAQLAEVRRMIGIADRARAAAAVGPRSTPQPTPQ